MLLAPVLVGIALGRNVFSRGTLALFIRIWISSHNLFVPAELTLRNRSGWSSNKQPAFRWKTPAFANRRSPQRTEPQFPQVGGILPQLLEPAPTPAVCFPTIWEEIMLKITSAILLLSSAAFAQDKQIDSNALQECPPIGQSAKGELIYGMDCKALKPENRVEVLSTMPPTNLPNTVIPKSGGKQDPDATPTKVQDR
jgi:hypothetical protein